jgi:hypothetical protein
MADNGISTLATKELRQQAKLDLAQLKRKGNTLTTDGSVVGVPDPSKPFYRDRNVYDISQLPTQYAGNNISDNPNLGGLVIGRPWVT